MKTTLKLGSLLLLLSASVVNAFGADNTTAIEYFKFLQFEPAKEILLQNQNDAEACFYLGEIYHLENKDDSAALFYKKGLSINAEDPYNAIGEAKLELKQNQKEASKKIEKIAKSHKKDIGVQLAAARAFQSAGLEYDDFLKNARKANNQDPNILIFEGDMLLAADQVGEACAKYEMAANADESCTEAYVKYAKIYANVNPDLSIQMLDKLLSKNPSSLVAQQTIAELYYDNGRYKKAAEVYGNFIKAGRPSERDINRYGGILFQSEEYDKVLELANVELEKNPDNMVMRRLAMYSLYELKKYEDGIKHGDHLMKNNKNFIPRDHIYYGRLLNKIKRNQEAVDQFKEALELEPDNLEIYKELSQALESNGQYDEAIQSFNTYIEKAGTENVKIADYLQLGQLYYSAASTLDSTQLDKRTEWFNAADKAFATVAEKAPENYIGYYWRANTNAMMDDSDLSQGLALPYYQKVIELLEADKKNPKRLIDAYNYCGSYYYLRRELPTSIQYWEKILQVDPNHPNAKKFIEGINKEIKEGIK